MSLLSLITGSHDLQQLIITNTSNDILCLQFIFVNGSTTNEVNLYLKSSNKSYQIGNVFRTIKLHLLNVSMIYLLVIIEHYKLCM